MKSFDPLAHFVFDERLGIHVPDLKTEWHRLTAEEQSEILYTWDVIRGRIPDRIFAFEREINELQHRLDHEENFEIVCSLSWDIADRASCINDLNLYFRLNEDAAVKTHQ